MSDVSICPGSPQRHDGTAIAMRYAETLDYSSVQAESVGVGGLMIYLSNADESCGAPSLSGSTSIAPRYQIVTALAPHKRSIGMLPLNELATYPGYSAHPPKPGAGRPSPRR